MTQHKHAAVLIAIASGHDEFQEILVDGTWRDVDATSVLQSIAGAYGATFRIKPKVIMINGFEIPAPITEEPEQKTFVYSLAFSEEATFIEWQWTGNPWEQMCLKRGLIHLTREAAEAHAHALLSFTAQQSDDVPDVAPSGATDHGADESNGANK